MKKALVFIVLAGMLLVSPVARATRISFQMALGSAYNFPTWLRIHQHGEEPIYIESARYVEKPFYEAPYYNWRFGVWQEGDAWELELVHHKIYLTNPPADVQHFEISHGYNLVTLNRAWLRKGFIWRLGAGFVLAHPESEVRGEKLEWENTNLDGFYAAGPTVQATLAKKYYLLAGLFTSVEAKLTASHAAVPVWDGQAFAPNIAVHGLFGLGYDFYSDE